PAPGALAVDGRELPASGIGRYLRERLAAWCAAPPFERLVLLGDPAAREAWLPERAAPVEVVPHAGGFYGPAAQRSWLRARRHPAVLGAVAAFFPHWDAPLRAMPARSVVTVHDLIPFRVPGAFPAAKRALARPALARVLRTAARVVCVSEASAADVRAWAPRAAARVVAIPNGVSPAFADGPAGPLPPGVAAPFLLCVGNQKPHKNLAAAVAVLARLRASGHPALRLVVAGREFAAGGVRELAQAAGVGDAVVAPGEVDDATLRGLYAACGALLFPSRYEGFGLPVLEAMAAGAPVVASDPPAVAEVAGDAAPLFAPDDVAGMAAACDRLLVDPAARRAAVERGGARAGGFRWEETARRTARVLRQVAASPRP
ncbi:glycosyltransferase family 1 protein, partial [Roseisolibacter sp. H3M3-2]|uniref:glycosyltransferase family 4 protein n=1 Tax=Roseisolibacter sp. H3M3-2 TaxID=3031323 RepID=UPI0023DA020F